MEQQQKKWKKYEVKNSEEERTKSKRR